MTSSISGSFTTVDDTTLTSGDSIMGDAVGLARLGPGKSLGPYIVLARLGVGTAGVLYSVYDPKSEDRLVVRVLRPPDEGADGEPTPADESPTRQLLARARALAAVRHPNIVRVHEVGMIQDIVYVSTSHLGGGSLREWLDAGERGWAERLDMLRAVGSGLAAAHRAGLVHGDLRPANVMLDGAGVPKLIDFGLLHRPGQAASTLRGPRRIDENTSVESLHAPLVRMGQWVGTPAYMSPEQYAGEQLGAAADQFSYCVMLYEALYGRLPFEARTIEALMLAIEERRVRPPPSGSKAPRTLHEIVARGLASDPKRRWPSMDALLDVLARDFDRPRRRLIAGAALGLAVAAGVAAMLADDAAPPDVSASAPSSESERLLLDARAIDPREAERAEALLLTALAQTDDDALGREIALELGVRLELGRADALANHQPAQARAHLDRARALLERQRDPNPTLQASLEQRLRSFP